jgi:hypothetical protein
MVAQVGYSVVGRSRGRVAPCAVYTVHMASKPRSTVCEWFGLKTTWTVFTGLDSKLVTMVCEWFGLKTTWTVFTGLASKPMATVSDGLASKPAVTVFSSLASKPVATVFSSLASKLVATVSSDLASKSAVGFLIEPQNQGGGGFSNLGLKTSSSGLGIWGSKSPRRFLGLTLKTKQASVCRLRHKTDGVRSARDTLRDLAACFVWKKVWPEDWRRRGGGWCTWHHRGGCVGGKLKTDCSIRWAALDTATLRLLLGRIYRTLEWIGLLASSQFHFIFPRVEVCQELIAILIIK